MTLKDSTKKDSRNLSPLHAVVEKEDTKTTNVFLEFLSGMRLDHHSREINDVLHLIVDTHLPNVGTYFESRIMQTDETK